MAAKDTVMPGWYSIEGAAIYTGFSVPSIRLGIELRRFPIRRVKVTGGSVIDPVRIRQRWLDAWCNGEEIPAEEFRDDLQPLKATAA